MALKSAEQIKQSLAIRGLTVTEWARHMGYSPGLVFQVLAGRVQCTRGKSHDIAVKLGLKRGVIGEIDDLDFMGEVETDVEENNQKK